MAYFEIIYIIIYLKNDSDNEENVEYLCLLEHISLMPDEKIQNSFIHKMKTDASR